MNVAYIRVSTQDQNLDRQRNTLRDSGIEFRRVFEEKKSGKDKDRPELTKMLRYVSKGDHIYVCSLDRLGRSVRDLNDIAEELKKKEVALHFMKEGIVLDASSDSAMGGLMFNIFAAFAEFERAYMRERQTEGIRAAIEAGKTWGAETQYCADKSKADSIFSRYFYGKIDTDKAVEEFGAPLGTFYYRYKKWRKENGLDEDFKGRTRGLKKGQSRYNTK